MKLAFAALIALAVAGCAGKPPPKIIYDSDDSLPAVKASEPPRPIRIRR